MNQKSLNLETLASLLGAVSKGKAGVHLRHDIGWVDPLGEDQFNIMKEWNLKKHHQQMIDNKRAAAQRRLEEAARKEAELQRLRATGAMLLGEKPGPGNTIFTDTYPVREFLY